MKAAKRLATLALLCAAACSRGPTPAAALDPKNDACANCRMAVSDVHFAAQLVAPREEPRFFDDLGCLRDYLAANPQRPQGTLAYVADHRTGEWVLATSAVYSQGPAIEAPMGSHLMAHATFASREQDPAARGTQVRRTEELFGQVALPGALTPQEKR